ncbi:helix-turn-helix domain-containing protein [Ruminiclostridium cellulolyticum]|uniref:Transcriptional regulator, XRE family n=1 Tax=Ruminiclostridium cellulolyticum (strain ATCC 35319 / DSM 5812 / JCM 6584 / H10) TaxID=394503 RepID=B8I8M7_RUMCH|nr:XRE family transcriptional regulator [Ruminiclostridium cellulolyticum]ACL75260.1 transcriptional regulator, XRE family [Ruminiclostridium cellulolyticum H10]
MKIGEKIKQLRVKNGLTQEELAGRCELSKGFISQLERDLTSPSIATLMDILESLGTNIKDFFNESVNEKVVFKKDDVFTKEDRDLGYVIHWLVSNAQKNTMEPILMKLDPGGSSELDNPHDGEEFGYVVSGGVIVFLGAQKYKVKKGECFYFKPVTIHKIVNAVKSQSVILWVSSPPSF